MSLSALDTLLFFFINRDIQNSFFDAIMPFITNRAYLLILPFYIWFFVKDRKKALIALALGLSSFMIADWLANSLKELIGRVRPCNGLEGVRAVVGCGKASSMPSNHSVNTFAFVTPFFILIKDKMKYAFVAIAVLVAFSRVYVGAHYPADVIAGSFIGVLLALSVFKFYGWSSRRYSVKPDSTILFVSLLAISLFRIYFIPNGPIDLGPDEAQYWEWSRRIDLSYYSKGPMIAYLIYLGTHIFGDTVFGIRIMAVLFAALSSVFMYLLGERLFDKRVGLCSALLLQVIPLFTVYGVVFTIDSPFIFFWILALFLFNECINRSQASTGGSLMLWSLLGLSIGLGLLTKYTMSFFYPCAFLFLLLSRERRNVLLTAGPYVAVIVSLIVFSPVIIWNANHDWVTLRHTAGQAHVSEGIRISLKSFVEFVGSQFGVITPLLFVLMAVSIWKLRKEEAGQFAFWFSVPIFAFFVAKSIQAKVQANWALPCYITGVLAFSAFYLSRFYQSGKVLRGIVIASVLLSILVTSVAHYPNLLNLPPDLDPSSRLRGWKELGTAVSDVYDEMSVVHPVFIFSDAYQVSSELAFYVKGHPTTYCINLGRRMNQYDLWPGFNNLLHYDAIFVTTGDVRLPQEVSDSFQKVEKKVLAAYTKKHAKIRDYSIFLCYDFNGLKERRPKTF